MLEKVTLWWRKTGSPIEASIAALCFDHKEAAIAQLSVTIDPATFTTWVDARGCRGSEGELEPLIHQGIEMRWGEIVIFRGWFNPIPHGSTSTSVTLQASAEPANRIAIERAFCEAVKAASTVEDPTWDSLFVDIDGPKPWEDAAALEGPCPSTQDQTPWQACVGTFDVPYWDPVVDGEGALRRSNLFDGRTCLDVTDSVLEDGLTWRLSGRAIRKLRVSLKATWVQRAQGVVPIGHKINQADGGGGQRGLVTYTPGYVMAQWWRSGHTLKGGHYTLQDSELVLVEAMSRDMTQDVPGKGVQGIQPARFEARLSVAWRYEQPRQEEVFMVLDNAALKHEDHLDGRVEHLEWQLGDLCHESGLSPWRGDTLYRPGDRVLMHGHIYQCQENHYAGLNFWEDTNKWVNKTKRRAPLPRGDASTFFETERGRLAIRHALRRAKVLLAHSTRSGIVSFRLPFTAGAALTLDHSLILRHPRLPYGGMRGKVVGLHHDLDFKLGKGVTTVTMAVSIAGIVDPGADCLPEEGKESLVPIDAANATPIMGLREASLITADTIVEQCLIVDNAADQEEFYQNWRARRGESYGEDFQDDPEAEDSSTFAAYQGESLTAMLPQVVPPTRVLLRLKDLSSYPCLERRIALRPMEYAAAPQQLGGREAG